MKIYCLGLLLALSSITLRAEDLAVSIDAQHHSHRLRRVWIRRATLAASCAASLALDTWSTHRALSAGAVETNPLLANSQGQTNWARTIGLKAGACGLSAVLEETGAFHRWQGPDADWTWTAINAATAAAFTATAMHNLGLAAPAIK